MLMSLSRFALLAGMISLAACGAAPDDEPSTAATGGAPAASAPAQPALAPAVVKGTPDGPSAVWIFGTEREEGVLSFTVPDTDIQPISFSCMAGSKNIMAYRYDGPAGLSEITFAAGGEQQTVAGRSRETEIPDKPYFQSDFFSADSGVMQNFEEGGSLRMTVAGRVYDMPSDEAGRGAILAFFAHCSPNA
jgi:hypothetical protein